MFLHCPPWRKPRPASPSDVARSYLDSQTRDVQEPRHQAQGMRLSHASKLHVDDCAKGDFNEIQHHILDQGIHRLLTRSTTPRVYRASFVADSLVSPDLRALIMSPASFCFHSLASHRGPRQNQTPSLVYWEPMAVA